MTVRMESRTTDIEMIDSEATTIRLTAATVVPTAYNLCTCAGSWLP